jgi:maleamate amidohydrolase
MKPHYGRRQILTQGGIIGASALTATSQAEASGVQRQASADSYERAGYDAEAQVGFGSKIGIVVVDFQRAFTDPLFPSGRSEHIQNAVANTRTLLRAARAAGVAVAQSYSAYSSERDMPYWKVGTTGSRAAAFGVNRAGTQLDPRTYDPRYDALFWKRAPSIFFGTSASAFFIRERVDTLVVTGCTTSGCIRATVVDAFSLGFRVIVPSSCCGDYDLAPHDANLRDVARRYADVVSLEACISAIAGQKAAEQSG